MGILLEEIQKDVLALKCQSCNPLALPVNSQLFWFLTGKAGVFCILLNDQSWIIAAAPGKQNKWRNKAIKCLKFCQILHCEDWHKLVSRYRDHFSSPALTDDNQFKKKQAEKLLKTSAGFNYTILCSTKSIEEIQWYLNLCLSLLAKG